MRKRIKDKFSDFGSTKGRVFPELKIGGSTGWFSEKLLLEVTEWVVIIWSGIVILGLVG
jgi:hypothetical protein